MPPKRERRRIGQPKTRIVDGVRTSIATGEPVSLADRRRAGLEPSIGSPQVSAQELTRPVQRLQLPEPAQPTTPLSFVQSFEPLVQQGEQFITRAQTREDEQRSSVLNRLLQTPRQDSQDTFDDAFAEAGGPENLQQLQQAQLRLGQLQGKFRRAGQRISGAEGQSQVFEGAQLNELSRQEAAEVGAQAAIVQALQGNHDLARQTALDAVNFSVADREARLNQLTEQFNALDGIVSDQEQQLIDERKAEVAAEKAALEDLKTAVSDAVTSGAATEDELRQLTNPDLPDEERMALAQAIQARAARSQLLLDQEEQRKRIEAIDADTGGSFKPPTQSQSQALGFAERIEQADATLTELGDQFTGAFSFGSLLPNAFKGGDRQRFEQASRNFINAVLRPESGAVISEEEFDNARKQYIPRRGDTPDVLRQKQQNRALVLRSLRLQSGLNLSNIAIDPEDPLTVR